MVVITGAFFDQITSVKFGITEAASFVVNSLTQITAVTPVNVPGTGVIRATNAAGTSDQTREALFTFTSDHWLYFVNASLTGGTNSQLNFFSTADDSMVGSIPLNVNVVTTALSPDGQMLYVLGSTATFARVFTVDIPQIAIVATIDVSGFGSAFDIMVGPVGTLAYCTFFDANLFSIVDVVNNVELMTFPIQGAGSLSMNPSGSTVYVASYGVGVWYPFSTGTFTFGPFLTPTDPSPGLVVVNPSGDNIYALGTAFGNVGVFDTTVDPPNLQTTIVLYPGDPDFSVGTYGGICLPAGDRLYVCNSFRTTEQIWSFNLPALTVANKITVPDAGSFPFWAVCTPTGEKLYVLSQQNYILPILTATDTQLATVQSGTTPDLHPQNILMSSDQSPVAYFSITSTGLVNTPSTFDATGSVSPVGTVALYLWDWGDGNNDSFIVPTAAHTYTSTGTFDVQLRVVNSSGTSVDVIWNTRTISKAGSSFLATVTHPIFIVS